MIRNGDAVWKEKLGSWLQEISNFNSLSPIISMCSYRLLFILVPLVLIREDNISCLSHRLTMEMS